MLLLLITIIIVNILAINVFITIMVLNTNHNIYDIFIITMITIMIIPLSIICCFIISNVSSANGIDVIKVTPSYLPYYH